MIGKVIKYKFDNTPALNSVFAGRVYPLIGAQGGRTPFAVYDITSVRVDGSKDADAHIDHYNVDITLVGKNYGQLQEAAENIRTAFVRMKETIEGVEVLSCGFENISEQYNPKEDTYAISVDLIFRTAK